MKPLVFTLALLVVCLLASQVDARKKKNKKRATPPPPAIITVQQFDEDQVVPINSCPLGLFDPAQCRCECNSIGDLQAPIYCLLNTLICSTFSREMSPGCCSERQELIARTPKKKSCKKGSHSGSHSG